MGTTTTTTIPPPRLITGWVERRDYPNKSDCPVDWANDDDDAIKSKSEELFVGYDKFGGYGRYCQGEGDDEAGYLKCHHCGQNRLYKRENFHMVDEGMLLGLGD